MLQLWRLLSGRINHAGSNGESHKAPYDFIPTDSELAANKWRMRFIRDVDEPVKTDRKIAVVSTEPAIKDQTQDIPAQIPVNTQKAPFLPGDDVRQVSVRLATEYINAVTSEADLDKALLQESNNTPKVRLMVVKAIQARRDYLLTIKPAIEFVTSTAAAMTPQEMVSKAIAGDEHETSEQGDDANPYSRADGIGR